MPFAFAPSSANNVVLRDTLPEGAQLQDGTLEATLGKISSGSEIKHTYKLAFSSANGRVIMPAVAVTYLAEPDASKPTVRLMWWQRP